MTIDYGIAAVRHLTDATVLHDQGRFPTADHLGGLAAECALKVALPRQPDGEVEPAFHHHIDTLWDRMPVQQLDRRFPSLASLLRGLRPGPFASWSVVQRYHDGVAITKQVSAAHLTAARRLCGAVGILGVRGPR